MILFLTLLIAATPQPTKSRAAKARKAKTTKAVKAMPAPPASHSPPPRAAPSRSAPLPAAPLPAAPLPAAPLPTTPLPGPGAPPPRERAAKPSPLRERQETPVTAPATTSPAPAQLSEPRPFWLAAALDARLGFGSPLTITAGGSLEFGYRLPFLDRALSLSIAGGGAYVSLRSSALQGSGFMGSVAPALGFAWRKDPHTFRVRAGPLAGYISTHTTSVIATTNDATWTIGADAALGYDYAFGQSRVGALVGYRLLPFIAAGNRIISHQVGLSLFYAYDL